MSKRPAPPGNRTDPRRSNRSRRKPGTIRLQLEQLEDRITPAGSLLYQALDDTSLLLRLAGADLQIVNADAPSVLLASKALGDITDGVTVPGNGYNVDPH